jgi:hypothetical protein
VNTAIGHGHDLAMVASVEHVVFSHQLHGLGSAGNGGTKLNGVSEIFEHGESPGGDWATALATPRQEVPIATSRVYAKAWFEVAQVPRKDRVCLARDRDFPRSGCPPQWCRKVWGIPKVGGMV